MKVLIATRNPGKAKSLNDLLLSAKAGGATLETLDSIGFLSDTVEDQHTFQGNATKDRRSRSF